MKHWILTGALTVAMVAGGCGNDEASGGTGGGGGAGGMGGGAAPTETTWSVSNIRVLEDECGIAGGIEEGSVFTISTSGNTAAIVSNDFPDLGGSTDSYSPDLTDIELTGSTSLEEPACTVIIDESFTLVLDDPSGSLPENMTVEVAWDHNEADESGGNCDGEYIVDLPCISAFDFTLTQTL